MKACTRCGREKPLDQFNRRAASKDGLSYRCKPCDVAAVVESMTRHPESRLAWRRKHRDTLNARQRAKRDPVEAGRRFKAYYDANRDAQRARAREWAKANPDKRRANQARRVARKANAPGVDYTTDTLIAARVALYGGRCFYCGAEDANTIDHRVPLARGGSHWPANLVPACGPCNYSKNTKTEKEFKGVMEIGIA